jgi:hypothetical protein
MSNVSLPVDLAVILVLLGTNVIIPFLVDIVTHRFASTQVKTLVLFVLQLITNVIVGFGQAHNNGVVFNWKAALFGLLVSIITSQPLIAWLHNLKVVGADGVLSTAFPTVGIGSPDPVKVDNANRTVVDSLPLAVAGELIQSAPVAPVVVNVHPPATTAPDTGQHTAVEPTDPAV